MTAADLGTRSRYGSREPFSNKLRQGVHDFEGSAFGDARTSSDHHVGMQPPPVRSFAEKESVKRSI